MHIWFDRSSPACHRTLATAPLQVYYQPPHLLSHRIAIALLSPMPHFPLIVPCPPTAVIPRFINCRCPLPPRRHRPPTSPRRLPLLCRCAAVTYLRYTTTSCAAGLTDYCSTITAFALRPPICRTFRSTCPARVPRFFHGFLQLPPTAAPPSPPGLTAYCHATTYCPTAAPAVFRRPRVCARTPSFVPCHCPG
jgi:hypothetical protein